MNPVNPAVRDRFVSAFVELYKFYEETETLESFLSVVDSFKLSAVSNRMVRSLFTELYEQNLVLTENDINSMTQERCRSFLVENTKAKNKEKIMEQETVNQETAMRSFRIKGQPDKIFATGEVLEQIKGFLKAEFGGIWDKANKRWELNVPDKIHSTKFYGMLLNKCVNAQRMKETKEKYEAEPTEQNFLEYGVANILYSEKVNVDWMEKQLVFIKEDVAKGEVTREKLGVSYEATLNAASYLKELGFLVEEVDKNTKGEELIRLKLPNLDVKQALADNMKDISDKEKMVLVAASINNKTDATEEKETPAANTQRPVQRQR